MRFKKSELDIDPENPFKEDKLERKNSAVILTELLRSIDEPFVLSINSPWGTGKTTFIKMWSWYLKQEGFSFIYFNAWENDFADPMIAFMGEIQSEIVRDLADKLPKAKKYFEKAKTIGGKVAKKALPVAVKVATAGILDISEFTEESIAEFLEEVTKKNIESYETEKKAMLEFKTNLEAFAKELSKETNLPLVFFIDELDRCRPNYTIELLERIKHFFSVNRVVFVLAIDRTELANTISSHYGIVNAEEYLRRFIDLEFLLPNNPKKEFGSYLFEALGFTEFFEKRRNEKIELIDAFVELAELFGVSLRAQEHIFISFAILVRTTPGNEGVFPLFSLFLIFLRMVKRELYRQFVNKNVSHTEVLAFILQNPKGKQFLDEEYGTKLEAELICANAESHQIEQSIKQFAEKLEQRQEMSSTEWHRTQYLKNLLEHHLFRRPYDLTARIAQRIDLTENFVQPSRK